LAIRPAWPPTRVGAIVRHSSSSRPCSTNELNSIGPPSVNTRGTPRSASTASTAAESTWAGSLIEQSTTSARPASVRRVWSAAAAQVHTIGGTSVRVNTQIPVQAARSGDDRQRRDFALPASLPALTLGDGWACAGVALGAHCARADQDHVGDFAQHVEHRPVAGPAQLTGLPPKVAPPSRLAMKFARSHTPWWSEG